MNDENGNVDCFGTQHCRNCTGCDNSTLCDNSTRCDNCAYCIYCCDLTLEKFMVFNKPVKTREAFFKIRDKITAELGYFKNPKQLTAKDIKWLKDNIKQFDRKVLDKIIGDSILPDKPVKE